MSIVPISRPITESALVRGSDKGGIYCSNITYNNIIKIMFWADRQLMKITEYDGTEHDFDMLSGLVVGGPITIYDLSLLANGDSTLTVNRPLAPVINASPWLQQPDTAVLHPPAMPYNLFGQASLPTYDKGTVTFILPPAVMLQGAQKLTIDIKRETAIVVLRDGTEITYDMGLFPYIVRNYAGIVVYPSLNYAMNVY